jgi:hypothetical protein
MGLCGSWNYPRFIRLVGVFVAMMTTIERMARAIAASEASQTDTLHYSYEASPGGYHEIAEAALKAFREPGLAIRHLTNFEFAEIEWPKLIDAALSEEVDVDE